jgi:pSer/pThr/pTyr-binding forkhead associated (FHA) protein
MLKQFFLHNSNKYEIYQGNQTLGRSFKNAISIEDASISKYHLLISSFDDYTEIIDLNTSNGTSINNNRLQPYEATKLNKGDKIRVGWVLIEYGTDYVDEKLLLGKSNF